MTKKGKIITGVVAGVTILGGIGALTDTDKPDSILELGTTTSAIIEEITEKTDTEATIEEITTTTEKTTTPTIAETTPATTTTDPEIEAITPAPETSATTEAMTTTEKKQVVYIAASGDGKKYHAIKTCSGMDGNVIEMSREEAEAAGYTPCQKNSCYK